MSLTHRSAAELAALMARGELAYVKLGRSRRVEVAALRELLDKNRVPGPVGPAAGAA